MSAAVVCFGELLLRLGAPGRQLLLQTPVLEVHIGGAEANVAVGLSRLGHRSAMVSAVPANPLGAAAVGALRLHGVDTRAVINAPDGRMGLYFLENGALQRPSSVLYDRAYTAFALQRADAWDWDAILSGAAWLHLSGVTPALGAQAAQAAAAAVAAAARLGVAVAFDGNYRAQLWNQWDSQPATLLRPLYAGCELLFANQRDIGVVLGGHQEAADPVQQTIDAASRAFAAFPRLRRMACTVRTQRSVDHHLLSALMVTAAGAVLRTAEVELGPIVDRIGTGDAFAAGLLHGLLSGVGDQPALELALAAACLKHALPGDFSLASAADLAAFGTQTGLDVRR